MSQLDDDDDMLYREMNPEDEYYMGDEEDEEDDNSCYPEDTTPITDPQNTLPSDTQSGGCFGVLLLPIIGIGVSAFMIYSFLIN